MRFTTVFLIPAIVFVLSACSVADKHSDKAVIKGELTYRERIAVPQDSILVVSVRKAEKGAQSSPVLAEMTMSVGNRQVPIPFEIPVNADLLENGATLGVTGRIRSQDGATLWSTRVTKELFPGQPEVDLGRMMMKRELTLKDQLADREWVVEDLNGAGIIDASRMTMAFLGDGRVAGSSSCNRYMGQYQLRGNRIEFGHTASTRMACAEALMQQEERFLQLLEDLETVEIDSTGALILRAPDGGSMTLR